jgi:hypothetical protein
MNQNCSIKQTKVDHATVPVTVADSRAYIKTQTGKSIWKEFCMKKNKVSIILKIVLVMILALSACTRQQASAQQASPETDFEARPIDGGRAVEITNYVGSSWEVRIPPRIQNLPVTHIGQEAFMYKNLISVAIPNGVTVIGGSLRTEVGAFAGNQLTSVSLPNSVTTIGAFAFYENQLTSVTIPNSVTDIGAAAFADNELTSVTIGNGVTVIGEDAFRANQLTRVSIPDSVTEIKSGAFDCMELTSIAIGANVTLYTGSRYAPSFELFFHTFYDQNGKRAGTYTWRDEDGWSAAYR